MIVPRFSALLLFLIYSQQLFGSESVLIYEYGAPNHQKFYYVHPNKVKRRDKEGNLFYITHHHVLAPGILVNPNYVTVTYNYDQKNPLSCQTISLKDYITGIDKLAKNETDRHAPDHHKTHTVNIALNDRCEKPLLPHLPMCHSNHVAGIIPSIANAYELKIGSRKRFETIERNKVEPQGLKSL